MTIVSDRLGQIAAVLTEFGVGNGDGNGAQPATVQVASFLFNEPTVAVPYPITAVNQGTPSVTIAGDYVARFPALNADVFLGNVSTVEITGSTGNDGSYTLVSATLVGGNTVIEVAEPLPDATVDGSIPQALLATWEVPENATVLEMFLVADAAPWADALASTGLSAYDSFTPTGYFISDVDPIQNSPYDPANATPGTSFVNVAYGAIGYQAASILKDTGGAGIPYPNGDTITMVVGGIATGGGGGILRVRIYYMIEAEPELAS